MFKAETPDDRSALADIYNRYSAWFKARLVRRYGMQEAEELLQETWLRLVPYRAAGDIRHPRAFLLRIASNLAADRNALQFNRTRYASEIYGTAPALHEPASQVDEFLAQQLVLGLPEPLRDVFVLSRISGLSNNQIAEQLGISPKTVEKRMTKAKAHCAAQLRL